MKGKIIFPYHKLQYLPQGELSTPSTAMDWPQHCLPLGVQSPTLAPRDVPWKVAALVREVLPQQKYPHNLFFFTFSLLPFPCFTHSACPSPLDKHQIANNIAVKQGYGPKP